MDPILLQKQIRDNSEDLGKYLKDLKNWEEDMKRKEKELYGNKCQEDEAEIPPVRSKIKRTSEPNTPVNEQPPKVGFQPQNVQKQRIPSHDYTAWDKFDVEKACEDVEKVTLESNAVKEAENSKNLEEALYEKENGNKLVRLGKWKEAMECYTRAISHDSNNAIFYANRAQCALKLLKWQDVIDDCCKALTIEPGYVKAYLRRSTARIKLQDYEGAIDDLNKAITLEPGNKEARSSLSEAKTLLQKAKTLSEQGENAMIVAISKPLHLRSKAPLKRIPIEEVSASGIETKKMPVTPPVSIIPSLQEKVVEKERPKPKKPVKPVAKVFTPSVPEVKPDEEEKIPPPPKTSVQFMLAWSQLKSDLRYNYLEQIPGADLPHLFGNSLESKVLSEVLLALSTSPQDARVYVYLEGLSQSRRFSAITLFMTSQDKSRTQDLIDRCLANGQCTEDQAKTLKQKYEL